MPDRIESTAVSADGTTIAVERQGTGPSVVMIDPAGGYRDVDNIRGLAGLLAGRFTVLTYDRRGRGRSGDTPPYAVAREVEIGEQTGGDVLRRATAPAPGDRQRG